MTKQVEIKLKRSTISILPKHKAIVAALGLRKTNSVVKHNLNPSIAGMLKKIDYLLEIKECN